MVSLKRIIPDIYTHFIAYCREFILCQVWRIVSSWRLNMQYENISLIYTSWLWRYGSTSIMHPTLIFLTTSKYWIELSLKCKIYTMGYCDENLYCYAYTKSNLFVKKATYPSKCWYWLKTNPSQLMQLTLWYMLQIFSSWNISHNHWSDIIMYIFKDKHRSWANKSSTYSKVSLYTFGKIGNGQ